MSLEKLAALAIKKNDISLAQAITRIAVDIPGLISEEYARAIPKGTTVPKSNLEEIYQIFRDTKSCRWFDDKHAGTKVSVNTARKKWRESNGKVVKLSDTTYAIILNPSAKVHVKFYLLDIGSE